MDDVSKKTTLHVSQPKKTHLTMKESFELINWLRARSIVSSDTCQSLADSAKAELKLPLLNRDHVAERMRQMEIKIPKAERRQPRDPAVAILAVALFELYANLGQTVPPELRALAQE